MPPGLDEKPTLYFVHMKSCWSTLFGRGMVSQPPRVLRYFSFPRETINLDPRKDQADQNFKVLLYIEILTGFTAVFICAINMT